VRGTVANRWRPIGPDKSEVMDSKEPYTGDHTPLIKLAGAEPRGIQQSGPALCKGKSYTGRVVLAGEAGARITVSLIWGPRPADRQVIPIMGLARSYSKFPLKFTAGGNGEDRRSEIAGTWQGSFHIGAVSLMPADNIRGFRPDTTGLLRQHRTGRYRFPGENFISAHEWRGTIGDSDKIVETPLIETSKALRNAPLSAHEFENSSIS